MKLFYKCLLFYLIVFLARAQNDTPTNIILLIGDGMGLTQITSGMYANGNKTILENFENIGLAKTHSFKNLITDSAASGTAIACGEKTYNGVLGINHKNKSIPSIINYCSSYGYKTALLSTSSIIHATPASFYSNVDSRNEYENIALQLLQSDVNYFIGGGKKYFTKRKDKKNILVDNNPYFMVDNLKDFSVSESDKVGYLTYEKEPPKKSQGRTPSLPKMLSTLLDRFNEQNVPFFVMAEGSQIDWGGHANNTSYVISEFDEFEETIQIAYNFAIKNKNTLVIITADHETGGMTLSGGDISKKMVKSKFNTRGHSATMVPVFAYGPFSEKFRGIYENTAIFHKMKTAVSE